MPSDATPAEFQEVLSVCGPIKGIHFEGRNVNVEFEHDNNSRYGCSTAVIMALKMGVNHKLYLPGKPRGTGSAPRNRAPQQGRAQTAMAWDTQPPKRNTKNNGDSWNTGQSNSSSGSGWGSANTTSSSSGWGGANTTSSSGWGSTNTTSSNSGFGNDNTTTSNSSWGSANTTSWDTTKPTSNTWDVDAMDYDNYPPKNEKRTASGPHYPFTLSAFSTVMNKTVSLDRDSINCVLVDTTITPPKSGAHTELDFISNKMGVAASINTTNEGRLYAREITMLPSNFPMLAPMLTLLFTTSPIVEFRFNSRKTIYLGVLIGADSTYNGVEFTFTHKLYTNELAEINGIRKMISDSISQLPSSQDLVGKIRPAIYNLVTRRRPQIRPRPKPSGFTYSSCKKSYDTQNTSFLPPLNVVSGVAVNDNDDYDSEGETQHKANDLVEAVKRKLVPELEEDTKPVLACSQCKSMLCAVAGVLKVESQHSKHTFKLNRAFGYVLEDGDGGDGAPALCRNKHKIGFCMEGSKFVDERSSVVVILPNGQTLPWTSDVCWHWC